jgi:predicted dehydrogenase
MASPEPIPLAVVGLRFGQHVIDGDLIQGRTPFRLVSICDTDVQRREACAAKYRVPACADIADILADPLVPAICLITPPGGRAELIRRCLRAGKHVMTTKPFEVDPAAALDVLIEAQERGLAVHLNSPGPMTPPWIRQVHQWVDRHQLGRLNLIEWHTHVPYREEADGGWYDDPRTCPVAPIFRLGIYALNDIHLLHDDEPESVTVLSSRFRTGRPTPDVATLSVRYRSGCLASLSCTLACESAGYPDTLALYYERGAIYRDLPPNLGRDDGHMLKVVAGGRGTLITIQEKVVAGGHGYDWERFAAWVRNGPQADDLEPERLVRSLRVIQAMSRSEANGHREDI